MQVVRGWPLHFFDTKEWQAVDERLKGLSDTGVVWNPGRRNLFAALEQCPLDKTRVILVGQDPYPNHSFACGLAFSIPRECKVYPPTLAMILRELQHDVDNFTFNSGDLSCWARQGVLLWNAIPSCNAGQSKSHHWPEWDGLTAEVFARVSRNYTVFAFLGSTAKTYDKYVDKSRSICLYTSHPSPRGMMRSQKPFLGSRTFSTINVELQQLGKQPIDWTIK